MGNLLLMGFLVVHSGIPFVEGSAFLRGHLYWAQVAGQDGDKASDHTTFVWSTMQRMHKTTSYTIVGDSFRGKKAVSIR
jgi:hypothetical protein